MNDKKLHHSVFQTVSYAVVAVAIVMLMYVCFLLLYPAKVLEVKSPLKIEPQNIVAGDAVTIKFKYCKYKDGDSKITIDYIGLAVIPSLSTQRAFPVGCHEQNLVLTVPTSAPTGEYYIHGTVSYQVNPLREVNYEFTTEPIWVKARTPSIQGEQGVQGIQGIQGVQGPRGNSSGQ